MLKMSTGHMEGDLQPLYLLLTDCYIYLLRKGKNMQWLLFMYLFLEVQFVTVLVCTRIDFRVCTI